MFEKLRPCVELPHLLEPTEHRKSRLHPCQLQQVVLHQLMGLYTLLFILLLLPTHSIIIFDPLQNYQQWLMTL